MAFVIGKTAVDAVSITFGSIIDFFLHTRVCRFSRRDVLNYALHLAHCSGDEFEYFWFSDSGSTLLLLLHDFGL